MAFALRDFVLLVVLMATLFCLSDAAPASSSGRKNRKKLKNRARDPQLSNQVQKKGIAKDITLSCKLSMFCCCFTLGGKPLPVIEENLRKFKKMFI